MFTFRLAAPIKYPIPFMLFLKPVISETSLNSWLCFSSGVTSLVTVLPPSFTRSLATPHSACASVTYTSPFHCCPGAPHASRKPYSMPMPASCTTSPVTSVDLMPQREPARPAARLVATPASS